MTRRESGSVLIEAMVAAALVALMLATMYRGVADSAMRQAGVTERRMALLVAQSEMDAVGSVLPLAPGTTSGTEGSYAWRVNVAPYPAPLGPSNAGRLMMVTVSVSERGAHVDLVSLKTLSIGPAS